MVRNVIVAVLSLLVLAAAATFAALNPGRLSLDLAFVEITTAKSLALIAAFGLGWVLGMVSVTLAMLRLFSERRRLRKSLRLAEQEVRALRSLPAIDAD